MARAWIAARRTNSFELRTATVCSCVRNASLGSSTAAMREVGSGMNGPRRRLARLLSDPAATVIVVEHRDRLARFGFEHVQAWVASAGRRVVVLDDAETADDLVGDVTEVLTWLCARWSGRRSASRRAARAVAVASGDEPR